MTKWTNDDQLFTLMRQELFTAVVGDILDKLGYLHQFLPPQIRPLRDDMVLLGRAMPVLEADIFSQEAGPNDDPFGLMFQALDDLKPNEVYVASGGSPRYALWGELMSVRASHLGAAGALLDGYCRDTTGILRQNFPTFSYGSYAQDQGVRGKVIDFRTCLEIDGIRVCPGDLIFGDVDGVLVIPQAVEEETITGALEKASQENLVEKAIRGGMSAAEAFKTYGVM